MCAGFADPKWERKSRAISKKAEVRRAHTPKSDRKVSAPDKLEKEKTT